MKHRPPVNSMTRHMMERYPPIYERKPEPAKPERKEAKIIPFRQSDATAQPETKP